jgi:hypothetical protein
VTLTGRVKHNLGLTVAISEEEAGFHMVGANVEVENGPAMCLMMGRHCIAVPVKVASGFRTERIESYNVFGFVSLSVYAAADDPSASNLQPEVLDMVAIHPMKSKNAIARQLEDGRRKWTVGLNANTIPCQQHAPAHGMLAWVATDGQRLAAGKYIAALASLKPLRCVHELCARATVLTSCLWKQRARLVHGRGHAGHESS